MKRLNPTARSLILICVLLGAANILLAGALINDSRRSIREQIESRMLDVANTAAAITSAARPDFQMSPSWSLNP